MTVVCDSILRTSLTTDKIVYSEYVVMHEAISSAESPPSSG
jgi:hypothetical protein